MSATAERPEARQQPVRWELRTTNRQVQAEALDSMPLIPKFWLAEFEIDSNWGEYRNDPAKHITNAESGGYIPFSFAHFGFDEYSQRIVAEKEYITIYTGQRHWHTKDDAGMARLADEAIRKASLFKGARPNKVSFENMKGGFDEFRDFFVPDLFKQGYSLDLGNFWLSLKEGGYQMKDSSFHVGKHGITLDLSRGLSAGEVLQLRDWFESLEKRAKKIDPSTFVDKR